MADDFDKYLPKEKRGVTDVPTNTGEEPSSAPELKEDSAA